MRRLRTLSLAFGLVIAGMAAGISIAKDPNPAASGPSRSTPASGDSIVEREVDPTALDSEAASNSSTASSVSDSPELAAVRFLELTEEVVRLSPNDGAEMQRSIASEAAADRLADDVFDLLSQLERDVPEGVEIHLAPLGISSIETASGWDVSIWYVEVVVYGDELAVEQWRTATYSLVEEGGEWRMHALDSADGPVPARPASVVGWSARSLVAAVAGFDDEVLEP